MREAGPLDTITLSSHFFQALGRGFISSSHDPFPCWCAAVNPAAARLRQPGSRIRSAGPAPPPAAGELGAAFTTRSAALHTYIDLQHRL